MVGVGTLGGATAAAGTPGLAPTAGTAGVSGGTTASAVTVTPNGGAAMGRAGTGAPAQAGGGAGATSSPTGFGTAGRPASSAGGAGSAAVGGASASTGGASGASGAAMGAAGAGPGGASDAGDGETGRLVGITEAHNVVRARIMSPTPNPPLPPLTWSNELAKIAQDYADKLAAEGGCRQLVHSGTRGLGENLAAYGGLMATPEDVVEGWAGEEECYTFGTFMRDDSCDMDCTTAQHSNGCGHYTQVVWRNTSEVGCGMATCGSGFSGGEVWVCNYKAPGNYVGMKPY